MLDGNAGNGSKKKLKIEMDKNKISPKNVWGKVVLFLKEQKKVALHVACGDITDVAIEGGKLVVRSSDDFLISVLEDGRREIENAIRWQGLDLEFEIIKFESAKQLQDKDMLKISRLFGEKVTIED